MGEAKRNIAALKASFLAELDRWDFPGSSWEAETAAELADLPRVLVPRYPDHALDYMRMKPKECHVNTRFMQDNDPEGQVRQVTGWWHQGGNYVLHSVIEQPGGLACVTPSPLHPENPFEFIPDPKIEWREEGDYRVAYRDGHPIGPGIRTDPQQELADLAEMRKRLHSGMNPYEAIRYGSRRGRPPSS